MFSEQVFPNGLRLITAPLKSTQAVTALVLVGSGSRYESSRERGIAHFLEHMFFKGGKKFDTSKEVSETIDSIGGDFNAYTGKEYAGYYVKCSSENTEVAFDVLGDMLLSAKLAPHDIEREKGVIIEELNMYEDTPMYQIGWDFEELLFGDTPMGRDQIGLPETIRSFSQKDFHHYRNDLYTPDNTVIIVSGDITPEISTRLVRQYFSFLEQKKTRKVSLAGISDVSIPVKIRQKKTEQAHFVIGFPGVPFGSDNEFSLRLLAIILGGNMSSRMFLNIREAKGLCYSISTSTDHYSDVGVISTHAGVDLLRMPEAISAISQEYKKVAEMGVTEQELQKAKNYLRGKLVLRMEDSEEIASFLGVQAMLKGDIHSLSDIFCRIESVSSKDILRVARQLFIPSKYYLSCIGPFSGREEEFMKCMGLPL
jgi:predicted Zn-dependent peptidase